MSDIAVSPTGNIEMKMNVRLIPYYHIIIEGSKKDKNFIAVKYDLADTYVKLIGFYTEANQEKIKTDYEQMIKETDVSSIIETIIPLNKINSITSLVYRHKTSK